MHLDLEGALNEDATRPVEMKGNDPQMARGKNTTRYMTYSFPHNREVEHGYITTIGGTHLLHPWLWEEG